MKKTGELKWLRTDEALDLLLNKFGVRITKPTLVDLAKNKGILKQPGGKFTHYFINQNGLEKLFDGKNQTSTE